jgi:hypothetical protein
MVNDNGIHAIALNSVLAKLNLLYKNTVIGF